MGPAGAGFKGASVQAKHSRPVCCAPRRPHRQHMSSPSRASSQSPSLSNLSCLGMCISRHGALYTWGAGKEGQLGLGVATTSSRVPRAVQGIDSEFIVTVSCGSDHTAAVAADGACPPPLPSPQPFPPLHRSPSVDAEALPDQPLSLPSSYLSFLRRKLTRVTHSTAHSLARVQGHCTHSVWHEGGG